MEPRPSPPFPNLRTQPACGSASHQPQEPLPTLTDANEREIANDFQSKLLRFRMVNRQRVCDAELDTRVFVPAMREEVRAWLAPICDCPDLQKSVTSSLCNVVKMSKEIGYPTTNAWSPKLHCSSVTSRDTDHFFIGDLAETVNDLLKGRHDDRVLTDKKVGLLLRALGIHGERVMKGYKSFAHRRRPRENPPRRGGLSGRLRTSRYRTVRLLC